MVYDNGALGVELSRRYAAAQDEEVRFAAAELAETALRGGVDPNTLRALLDIALDLHQVASDDGDERLTDITTRLLLRYAETVDAVLDAALAQLAGDGPAHFYGVANWVERDPERIFKALMERARRRPEDADQILQALGNESLSATHTEALLAFAEEAQAQGHVSLIAFAMTVEYRLYFVRDDPPSERLTRLARELLTGPDPTGRRTINFWLKGDPNPGARALHRELSSLRNSAQ